MVALTSTAIKSHLHLCGYRPALIRANVRIPRSDRTAIVAFFEEPTDARSACIAIIATDRPDSKEDVAACRELGAPIVLTIEPDGLEFWQQRGDFPLRLEKVPADRIAHFFSKRKSEFAPAAVYRAKTRSPFESGCQLSFVDRGLMPVVETAIGAELSRLVERAIVDMRRAFGGGQISEERGRWIFQSVFWLLAAKILHDKGVAAFADLDLADPRAVLKAVAEHYHSQTTPTAGSDRERQAHKRAAEMFAAFSSLAHVTTESLAYLYESTLITKSTRRQLGTHSTPTYLVDYVVANVAPLIEEIAPSSRNVFEPAAGHAGFLVSAMRLLRSLIPTVPQSKQRIYLRERLRGIEKDAFAVEIGKLSLTLADAPNPNGFDLKLGDMFAGNVLADAAAKSMVLLCNPPFERFSDAEKAAAAKEGKKLASTKATEVLARTLPALPIGAVFGAVVPHSFLHGANAAAVRKLICTQFEILEITLFPDRIFSFSDAESAVILARRTTGGPRSDLQIRYRRVRENDIERFKNDYSATTDRTLPQSRFSAKDNWRLLVPEMEAVWERCAGKPTLGSQCELGQGLAYHGEHLPPGSVTYSKENFSGAVRGFVHFDAPFSHLLPTEYWMSLDPSAVQWFRTGRPSNRPQVVLNYASVNRGPWRLRALLDERGHAVSSRFITVRPHDPDSPVLFWWALLNSPFANAFAYARLGKRDNLVGELRKMPVPTATADEVDVIVACAKTYLAAVQRGGARSELLSLDAAVLDLYRLPPRVERELLDLFAGWTRPSVPFVFDRYFPEGFRPAIPLRLFVSPEYAKTTAGALVGRFKPAPDAVLQAMEDDE